MSGLELGLTLTQGVEVVLLWCDGLGLWVRVVGKFLAAKNSTMSISMEVLFRCIVQSLYFIDVWSPVTTALSEAVLESLQVASVVTDMAPCVDMSIVGHFIDRVHGANGLSVS